MLMSCCGSYAVCISGASGDIYVLDGNTWHIHQLQNVSAPMTNLESNLTARLRDRLYQNVQPPTSSSRKAHAAIAIAIAAPLWYALVTVQSAGSFTALSCNQMYI